MNCFYYIINYYLDVITPKIGVFRYILLKMYINFTPKVGVSNTPHLGIGCRQPCK